MSIVRPSPAIIVEKQQARTDCKVIEQLDISFGS